MLKLSLSIEEYLQIGDNVRIAFLGGSPSHLRIVVDAPPEVNIARGNAIAKRQGDTADLPTYKSEKKLKQAKNGDSNIFVHSNKGQKSAYRLAMELKDKENKEATMEHIPGYEWREKKTDIASRKKK